MSVANDNRILFNFKKLIKYFTYQYYDFTASCINKLYLIKFKPIFPFKAIYFILNKG